MATEAQTDSLIYQVALYQWCLRRGVGRRVNRGLIVQVA